MKENKYDDRAFFEAYSEFPRSKEGLAAAGEWHRLEQMLPDFCGKRVLDIGCGFGWHCRYAAAQGAKTVVGTDISEKMLAVAREKTGYGNVEYRKAAMEDLDFAENSFDSIISSLAFHYTPDFEYMCKKIHRFLTPGGYFVFSAEHPVFTAYGTQDWLYGDNGNIVCWPVDRYFEEGSRQPLFLGERVTKYHRTMESYLKALLDAGFSIVDFAEPKPTKEMMEIAAMKEELRRPMMFIVAAQKK
ncbi:MAG: class I SAM-dependent methyltransferase [Christensenellaceae bacterium]|jgi:ubiquinone/menaquinone biosynthesis C-methylase UbiE